MARMTTRNKRDVQDRRDVQGQGARIAARGLALVASPTFAVMALLAVVDPAPPALCAAPPGILPVDGMTAMYLLMSLFHLSPWLKLASGDPMTTKGDQ